MDVGKGMDQTRRRVKMKCEQLLLSRHKDNNLALFHWNYFTWISHSRLFHVSLGPWQKPSAELMLSTDNSSVSTMDILLWSLTAWSMKPAGTVAETRNLHFVKLPWGKTVELLGDEDLQTSAIRTFEGLMHPLNWSWKDRTRLWLSLRPRPTRRHMTKETETTQTASCSSVTAVLVSTCNQPTNQPTTCMMSTVRSPKS